jgi:putative DNA primase/helicase
MRLDAEEIKRMAAGRWLSIHRSVCGLTDDQLDPGKHGPCPVCKGKDRFRALPTVADDGALYCSQCHHGGSTPKSGDGFSAIQRIRGCTFSEALKLVADELGHAAHGQNGNAHPIPDGGDLFSRLDAAEGSP